MTTYTAPKMAKALGISTATFQKWETQFDNIAPQYDDKGNRYYIESDLATWQRVQQLIRERGMSVESARQEFDRLAALEEEKRAAIQKLKAIRGFLTQMAADFE